MIDHRSRVFFLLFFLFSFLAMCILDAFEHFVGTERGCNWYLRDINIFPLSKKWDHQRAWRGCLARPYWLCRVVGDVEASMGFAAGSITCLFN